MNPTDFLTRVEQHQSELANRPSPEKVFVESQFKSVLSALEEATNAMLQFLKSQEIQTRVSNFPEPKDNTDVVRAVKGLEKTLKPNKQDNSDIIKAVKALQTDVKKLPSAMPDSDQAVVQSLKQLTDRFSSEIGSLLAAVKKQDLKPNITVPTPKVTVQPTPVEVQATDVKGLIKAIEKVKKAVDEKPIPVANTPTDPLIKYNPADIDDAGTVQYFGYTDNLGAWYIKKFDTSVSPKTLRYCFGQSNYATNFTNRASLTYALWGS